MLQAQEWLLAYRAGWLRTGLDAFVGPSLAFDLALHGLGTLVVFCAVARIGGSRRHGTAAALLYAIHPAAATAISHDARSVLLTNLAVATAVALAGLGASVGRRVLAFLALAAGACCGTPGGAAGFLVLGYGWIRGGSKALGSGAAVAFVLDTALRVAVAVPSGTAAATAGFLALAPVAPGYDLRAMGPWYALGTPVPLGLAPGLLERAAAWVPAAAAIALASASHGLRPIAALYAALLGLLTFAASETDFLHDRASLLLAPPASAILTASIAPRREGPARRWANELPVMLLTAAFAILFAHAWVESRDTDTYLERAVQAAPGSPILEEAYGQVLRARARRGDAPRTERAEWLRRAGDVLVRGAAHASRERKFRMVASASDAYRRAGDSEAAAAALRRASELAVSDAERAEAAILRFRYLEDQGDPEGALGCLRAAIAELPESTELRCQYLDTASARFQAGMGGGVAASADGAADLDAWIARELRTDVPRDVRAAAYVARGRLSLARGRAVEAVRDFEDSKRIDPRRAEPYMGAAAAYVLQGLLDGAERELTAGLTAVEPEPPVSLVSSLAEVRLARGADPGPLIELLRAARQGDPDDPRIASVLSLALAADAERKLEKGDLTSAEALAREALAEGGDVARARAVLGQLRERQRRFDEAVEELREAHRLEPTPERREQLASALKAAGMAALLQRERARAVEWFLELRRLEPESVELGTGLDILREEARSEYNAAVDARDPVVARRHLERSLELLPENFYALYALGTLEAEAGGEAHSNDVKAIELWTRALRSARADGIDLAGFALHLNLAQAHYRRRDDARVRELLTEYLSFGHGPYQARCQALLEVLDVGRR